MSRANPATTHDNAGIAAWNFKLTHEVHSYEDATRALTALYASAGPEHIGTDRIKYVMHHRETHYGQKFGPHMWLVDLGSYIAVVLYDTQIVRYYPDGTFSVDNGGFNTPTTSERIGAVVPDGFWAYHKQKMLGLHHVDFRGVLWPLDHTKRINPTTITVTEVIL